MKGLIRAAVVFIGTIFYVTCAFSEWKHYEYIDEFSGERISYAESSWSYPTNSSKKISAALQVNDDGDSVILAFSRPMSVLEGEVIAPGYRMYTYRALIDGSREDLSVGMKVFNDYMVIAENGFASRLKGIHTFKLEVVTSSETLIYDFSMIGSSKAINKI